MYYPKCWNASYRIIWHKISKTVAHFLLIILTSTVQWLRLFFVSLSVCVCRSHTVHVKFRTGGISEMWGTTPGASETWHVYSQHAVAELCHSNQWKLPHHPQRPHIPAAAEPHRLWTSASSDRETAQVQLNRSKIWETRGNKSTFAKHLIIHLCCICVRHFSRS